MEKNKWQAGLWTLNELQLALYSVQDLATAMGGTDEFKANLGGVTITQKDLADGIGGTGKAHEVTLDSDGISKWTIVHELNHAWDGANGWKLSRAMQSSMGAHFDHPFLHRIHPDDPAYWYDPGQQGPPPCGVDASFNAKEDFAEAVTAYVYPVLASNNASTNGWPYNDTVRGYSYSSYRDTPRGQYIANLLTSNP
jgi:hypothetical protein